MRPRIGITLGDPMGIGPEVAAKALAAIGPNRAEFVVYAAPERYSFEHPVAYRGPDHSDNPTPDERARFCLEALDRAAADAAQGTIDALVTGPLDKAVVRTRLPSFQGHTEYLGEKAGAERTVMLLDNGEMSVILLTNHVPLREVARRLNAGDAVEIVRIARRTLVERLGMEDPPFSFLGLNPHAGEIAPDAEESTVLADAIARLRAEGIDARGPFAADAYFAKPKTRAQGVTVACYHDQGLIPIKYAGFDRVVNVTLGLPYLRVSPGHGTAYDIFNQGLADPRSMARAIEVAITRRIR